MNWIEIPLLRDEGRVSRTTMTNRAVDLLAIVTLMDVFEELHVAGEWGGAKLVYHAQSYLWDRVTYAREVGPRKELERVNAEAALAKVPKRWTSYHLVVSVRGMLHWSDAETRRQLKYITKDDGSHFGSIQELRSMLMDELAKGHEVLKTGECDNHDWKKGCLGHEEKEQNTATEAGLSTASASARTSVEMTTSGVGVGVGDVA